MSRIAQLEKLLEVDPADADVLYMLAQEHAKRGAHGAAVEWYDRCIAAEPTYAYAYFHKARAQEASGDLSSARATLRAGMPSPRSSATDRCA